MPVFVLDISVVGKIIFQSNPCVSEQYVHVWFTLYSQYSSSLLWFSGE